MDPTTTFCPNVACPARGQTGQGNIGIHSRKDERFVCTQCHKTFTATKGTAFYRLRTSAETVTLVVTLSGPWLPHCRPSSSRLASTSAPGPSPPGAQAAKDKRCRSIWSSHRVTSDRYKPMSIRVVETGRHRAHGLGDDGLDRLAAGRRNQRAAGYAIDPTTDLTALSACATGPASAVGLYRWFGVVHPGHSGDLSRSRAHRHGRRRPRLRPWRHVLIAQVIKRYERRRGSSTLNPVGMVRLHC